MFLGFRQGCLFAFAAFVAWLPAARAQTAAVVAPEIPPTPHVLVYPDGDRVQGRVVAREGDVIVFRSARFGEIRVAAKDVTVITAPVAAQRALVPAKSDGTSAGAATAEPGEASEPEGLARFLKSVFGEWHGRFAFSTQVKHDASDRADVMVEGRIKRTWDKDEVNVAARYDYNETNGVDTTDKFTGNGLWRHRLKEPFFTVYRPSYEWNRAATLGAISYDYILLQQEVGLGLTVIKTDRWNVRIGVAENFFDNWDLTADQHRASNAESVFLEADLKLPWRVTLTERAVYFYSLKTGNDGWENQFEITKKLTDTLSLGLRQESRHNDPDLRAEDYSLVRFLVGFDF